MKRALSIGLALAGLIVIPAAAAVQINYASQAADYTVCSTDLVNGLGPIVVGQASLYTGWQLWNLEGIAGSNAVNDGLFSGRASVGTGGNRYHNSGGQDIIWNFEPAMNIGSLDLYFSWGDGGRDNVPVLKVYASSTPYVLTSGPNPDGQYSVGAVDAGVATNGGFNLLATTVNTAPSTGNKSKVSIYNDAGALATGVKSLYIQFGAAENGWVGLNEADVFIAPVPEPAALGLALLTGVALLRKR